ncbi:MAG: DUF6478 family protein [Pseudomonadota bacterium]
MPNRLPGLIASLRSRNAAADWQRAAEAGETVDIGALAKLAPLARDLARHAGEVARVSEMRLSGASAAQRIDRPPQCDWAWRPAPWAAALPPSTRAGVRGGDTLTEGVTLFHDCPLAEITLRQVQASDPGAPAPYVLEMDALGFAGSFLSLAMDLPKDGAKTLQRSHIVGLSTTVWMEREAEIFARLNIRQGPNTEQLVSELKPGERPDSPVTAEFDLGFHDIKPAKLDHAWIDLIFDKPQMNLVRIADLTLTRRPRADI